MDTDFIDDDGAQQSRRRQFQTGILILLLLFFIEPRAPEERQRHNKDVAQLRKNKATLAKTVNMLAEPLKMISHGNAVALNVKAGIAAELLQKDPNDVQTVVPAMKAEATEDAAITAVLAMIQATRKIKDASHYPRVVIFDAIFYAGCKENGSNPFGLLPDRRNDTIDSSNIKMLTIGEIMSTRIIDHPDVSAVQGWLKLGNSWTHGSGVGNAVFEGLFFHEFGHLSAVVGVSGESLKLVWDSPNLSNFSFPRTVVAPNASVDGRLVSGADGGGESSALDEAKTSDYTSDEDSDKRDRVLSVMGGGGPEQGRHTQAFSGKEELRRAQYEAASGVKWESREDRLTGGAGERLRGWGQERELLQGVVGGPLDNVLGRRERTRKGRAQLSQGWERATNEDETRSSGGGGRWRRHLKGIATTPSPTIASNLPNAVDVAVAHAPDDMIEAGAEAGKGELANANWGLRDFPAMVLPANAVVGPKQKSGTLPSQLGSLRPEFKSDCLFLLTLQTSADEPADDDKDKGETDGRTYEARVDQMRGELVGVNCNFSANIKVQFKNPLKGNTWSYPAMILLFCVLHMCVLCCRIGFILARRSYGQNFFVPRRFQPPKFDYHRPIPSELVDQSSRETAGGQDSEEGRDIETGNLLECAICYASVDDALQDYMLTPCDHVFHQGCLARWMDVKMECPTCRRELPAPLE